MSAQDYELFEHAFDAPDGTVVQPTAGISEDGAWAHAYPAGTPLTGLLMRSNVNNGE